MNETTDLNQRTPNAIWTESTGWRSVDGFWWWDGKQWLPTSGYHPALGMMRQQSMTLSQRHTNHTFHLLMTIFTFGLWSPIWIIMTIANSLGVERSRTYSN